MDNSPKEPPDDWKVRLGVIAVTVVIFAVAGAFIDFVSPIVVGSPYSMHDSITGHAEEEAARREMAAADNDRKLFHIKRGAAVGASLGLLWCLTERFRRQN